MRLNLEITVTFDDDDSLNKIKNGFEGFGLLSNYRDEIARRFLDALGTATPTLHGSASALREAHKVVREFTEPAFADLPHTLGSISKADAVFQTIEFAADKMISEIFAEPFDVNRVKINAGELALFSTYSQQASDAKELMALARARSRELNHEREVPAMEIAF